MNESLFDREYARLNQAQKKAVDAVEGPVLVIAGPGTGKTHILTLRIANILKQTQANASNILVLTFTESAARTVRERLAVIVGERVAREVFITTFHGFAEHLISTHADSFTHTRGKRLAGAVETTLLWRDVLDSEELTALRTTKSPYFYLKDLARLQGDLLRECISLSDYRTWTKEEEARIRGDESLLYVRGERKGELKQEGEKKLERLEKVYEAARLIEAYEALKEKRGVYDFADVLHVAVEGLQNDAELRSVVQEQYQYVLADEHQDANALQHALLDVLAYDEHPNIFVVGDEKQAIYRFQGADSSHFKTFTEHFPRTEVIYLVESYRSLEGILTAAHSLIEQVPASTGNHQALLAIRKGDATLAVLAAPDPLAESDQIAALVEAAIKEGTLPHEIAVIASRNSTATLFAEVLASRGIPTLRAGDVVLSSRPLLRSLLAMMRAIADPLDLKALRECMLAPWWDIDMKDRAELLLKNRDKELWTALLASHREIASCLKSLQEAALDTAPLPLLSKLILDTGARAYMLQNAEHLEDVLLVRKIYMHIEEIVRRDPNRTFSDVVSALTKAHEHGLESITSSRTFEEGKVTVITAHKAKGMEFEKVFVVGLNARQWEGGGMPAKIPSPIDQARSIEDVTKLFYVALTRAKNALVLSYALENGEGKDLAPSLLIPEGLARITPLYDPLPLLHTTVDANVVVTELVHRYLTQEGLSPSACNEYLESPATFFARRVLRLSEPEVPATAIGIAVHAGIAEFLSTKDAEKSHVALSRCLKNSLLPRTIAYDRVVEHATGSLNAYLAHPHKEGVTTAIEKAFSLTRNVAGTEILLCGKVDAIFETGAGECIVDFKTSSDVHIKDQKHARQLAFYDFLLRENGHHTTSAAIVQVGPGVVKEFPIPLTEETRAEFLVTLEEVVSELLTGSWRAGAPSPYDDLLALFA